MIWRWFWRTFLACGVGICGACTTGSGHLQSHAHAALVPALPGGAPPGAAPVVCAPGFITTGVNTRDATLTPDGRELCFCMATPGYAQAAILQHDF